MIMLTKGIDTKILSQESGLIEKLITMGWAVKEEEKVIEKKEKVNGKPSKSSN